MAGTAKVGDTVYNRHIAKRNIRMSNLTPDDVDLRLTATKAELTEEDQRLWLGLEDEKISRIAGDEANKQFTELVKQQNSGTESRLSTEVIHRSEGDVSNLNSLNAVAQALSDYRIKTDLEINNEVIARKALGVELNSRINSFVSTWDHQKYLIYQAIQDVQDDLDGKYSSMDTRIVKYEQMLSDITADSIQITTDNGEINMGAWTILSQAREWDLQIIGRMKDFQVNTQQDLNQALEDIQNKLPVEQNIIDKAIQGLSNSQVIKDLDEKITSNIADINSVNQNLLGEVTNRQNEMIAQARNTADAIKSQADELTAAVIAETAARIDAVTREADIRTLQIEGINSSISEETEERIEEIRLLNDGLTAEVNSRVEGDQNITTSLDNYKESNDTALANVRNTVEVLVSDTTVMSQTVSSLDARLTVTEASTATANSLAASANEKANTALTATTSLAERMESVEASIETVQGNLTNKVDVIAFNSLKTEVTAIDGRVTTNTANIASITGNITDISSQLSANTTAISELSAEQTQQGNDIEQVSSQITQLSADIDSVQNTVANKADASAVASLTTQVNQQGENITLINSDVTTLKGSVSTIEGNLASKADSTALNSLSSKVTAVDDKVSSHSGQITALNASIDNISVGGANLLKNSEGVFTPNMSITDNYVIYQSSTVDMINGKEYTLSGETNGEWSSEHNADAESNRAVLWLVGNGLHIVISDSSVGTKGRTFVWGNPSGTYVLRLNSYKVDNSIWFKNIKIESGNKRTDWTPATSDTASAAALSTLDTKVTSIDGRVTANTSSVTDLQSTVNNNQANLINSYYTKTSTDIAISNQITSLSATLDMNVLPSKRDLTKANQWLLTHVIPKAAGWVSQGVYPDFSVLKTGIKYNRIYCADGSTNLSGTEYDNTVLYFRTIVYVHEDKIVNLGSFIGDDAHSIYVNGVLNFTKDYYGSTDNLQLALKQGLNTVDVICYNGGGLAGFVSSVLLSSLVVNMYAPESVEEQAAATANAVSSLTATVSDIDGRVTSNAGSITNLQAGLTAANNSISTKADSSALNALTARVDSTESGIQATNTSVTSLESKLNNVSVGATNLLPDTKNVGNIGTYLDFGYKRSTRPGGSTQYVDPLGYFVNNLSAGTYVLSFYARANKVQYVNNFFYAPDNTQSAESSTGGKSNNSNGCVTAILTTEWKRYWVRWTIPSDTESKGLVIARLDDYDSSERWIEIAAPKLEKGTLATDWSPAPSDLSFDASLFASASALSTLDTKVNSIDGKVTTHASSITQLQADVSGNSSKLVVQGDVVNGLKASYVVKTDVNGLVTGYGLYNEGGVGAFGVNADYFYVGNGTTATGGKKPFMVLTSAQTIDGITYPAGTWIDVALIANASITDAHIVNLNASKITAGTIDAERIGANSISVEKLMVGDATNLWGNQHFNPNGPLLGGSRTRVVTDMPELKGNGIQMWGRDHYASYSTKIPLKEGDTFVIEYIAGRNGGPDVPLHVGLWTYNINGNGGSAPWQSGPAEQIADLGSGWFRWRRIFVVTNYGHALPVAYGVLFFVVQQGANEPDPAYWSVGDVTVRKGTGGELIVNGSVTADKMQVDSLSAISADLGTIKVGSANIADLAVTTAKIGDLQVDTLKIKDNAVTVPVYSYTSGIAYIDSSRWATSQSIWAPCSNGVTLFFFNFSYDCRRQDTRYAVKCRILKDGVIVRPEFTIFYFEADANNINVKSRPAGTLSLNHADNTGVDGTFELQFYMSAGNGWNVDNRYTSSLTVRK